jgi:hypothetical protein
MFESLAPPTPPVYPAHHEKWMVDGQKEIFHWVSQNLPPMRIDLEICTNFGKPFVTHITRVFLFNFFNIGKFGNIYSRKILSLEK